MRFALALVACLPLAACSTSLDAVVTGPLAEPTVAFVNTAGARLQVCVDDLQVRRGREIVWSISVVEGDCALLDEVAFGQVPQGFRGGRPTQAMEAGVAYQVFGRGWGRGIPWYGGGAYRFEGGAWREIEPPAPVID